jgi:thioredoxin reductase (NADPH)
VFDCDAVIIGAGPAGLTAGIYLSRAGWRTVVLEKESFGGYLKKIEWIENYPGFPEGISGSILGSEMVKQAEAWGVQLEFGEVTGIELFSKTRWVGCDNGKGYTTAVVIAAGGCRKKKLNVPGEEKLLGKGVFNCALCDGNQYADKVVAICGGGDAAVTEARYMARLASKVYLIELQDNLTACSILKDRVVDDPKIEILCGTRVKEIAGQDRVEGLICHQPATDQTLSLAVDGVLVHIGMDPNTQFLDGILTLNEDRRIQVDPAMSSEVEYVFAAGDVRGGSPGQVATAVGDGAMAAISAHRVLETISRGH